MPTRSAHQGRTAGELRWAFVKYTIVTCSTVYMITALAAAFSILTSQP